MCPCENRHRCLVTAVEAWQGSLFLPCPCPLCAQVTTPGLSLSPRLTGLGAAAPRGHEGSGWLTSSGVSSSPTARKLSHGLLGPRTVTSAFRPRLSQDGGTSSTASWHRSPHIFTSSTGWPHPTSRSGVVLGPG